MTKLTPVGEGLVAMRRYLRWNNGNKIKPEYWNAMIAELEADARREYAHNLLHQMYAQGTSDMENLHFIVTDLHNEAGE